MYQFQLFIGGAFVTEGTVAELEEAIQEAVKEDFSNFDETEIEIKIAKEVNAYIEINKLPETEIREVSYSNKSYRAIVRGSEICDAEDEDTMIERLNEYLAEHPEDEDEIEVYAEQGMDFQIKDWQVEVEVEIEPEVKLELEDLHEVDLRKRQQELLEELNKITTLLANK